MNRMSDWLPVRLRRASMRARQTTIRALTLVNVVGVAGFEPAASSSRTKRAAKLRHTPATA
jgi:hypothetical protein